MDFDSPELAEYPDVQRRVSASEMEPGQVMVEGKLFPLWDVPYSRMVMEFERLGAKRVKSAAQ